MTDDQGPQRAGPRMRALVQHSDRGPSDLILHEDQQRPRPGPDDYLVRVEAAGVNFADTMQTRGSYGGGPRPPYPAGFEAVGEIVAVGSRVAGPLPTGTRIVGTGPGAFAQFLAMPAAGVLPIPDNWTSAAALGMVLNWGTALAALRPMGMITPGDTVLIHAAAGGVGQPAVRLARHFGARVIATASVSKHPAVRAAGADDVLDRDHPDLAAEILRRTDGVDLVLDSVGRTSVPVSLGVARPYTGRVIVFGTASGPAAVSMEKMIFEHPVQLKGLHIGSLATSAPALYRNVLAELTDLIRLGVYPPGRPEIHPLADGPRVLADLEAGRTTGKQALDPWR
ncbi:NADPH:quinone oxidoreductase family protein [Microlunatus soli]|uniref:NADPH:quinone reductase n=1 Tax=Microlunatus soli TaxID=630515 RepID=A0A1H2AP95_9ACTN|nr:NADPH:quinone oxidoreductase family protein [Microlunatus soli]SDT47709.1 NADPH:quinone reductase [Microlunatus soli]